MSGVSSVEDVGSGVDGCRGCTDGVCHCGPVCDTCVADVAQLMPLLLFLWVRYSSRDGSDTPLPQLSLLCMAFPWHCYYGIKLAFEHTGQFRCQAIGTSMRNTCMR